MTGDCGLKQFGFLSLSGGFSNRWNRPDMSSSGCSFITVARRSPLDFYLKCNQPCVGLGHFSFTWHCNKYVASVTRVAPATQNAIYFIILIFSGTKDCVRASAITFDDDDDGGGGDGKGDNTNIKSNKNLFSNWILCTPRFHLWHSIRPV